MDFGYAGWFRLYDTAIGIVFARTSDKTSASAEALEKACLLAWINGELHLKWIEYTPFHMIGRAVISADI